MINVRELVFRYPQGSHPVLKGIDLDIAQGSLFGLLGPNGAGKTTLLSILCGLLPSQVGAVLIDGKDVAVSPSQALASTSLVPQEFAFYPTLTARENLHFFAGIQQIPPADIIGRIDAAAYTAGLAERLDDRADRLSGGLKRRLNLAIGLLIQPALLLLDEPTVGIDPQSRRFILDAIKIINGGGTTVVYTSHYMEEVEYLCDDIAIIDKGAVLVRGSLGDLLAAEAAADDARNLEELFLKFTNRSLRD